MNRLAGLIIERALVVKNIRRVMTLATNAVAARVLMKDGKAAGVAYINNQSRAAPRSG